MRHIMHHYKSILIISLLSITVASCRSYVEQVPIQGQRVLVYTEDYRSLMNGEDQQEVAFGLAPILSSDDIEIIAPEIEANVNRSSIQVAMYTWRKPFYVDLASDNDWNAIYGAMYKYNVVIGGVLNSKGGDMQTKENILGEALLQRAFSYFMLANLYGKQYDAATADKDPGVPILLEPKLFVDLKRATVKATYEQVLKDIRAGLPMLPAKPIINFRPSKVSAYALLSKVYLYMRDFKNAEAFADSTLAISNELYDYNTAVASSSFIFPQQYNDPEVLLRKVPRQTATLQLSQPLLDLLGTKDLRYELFVRPGNNFYPAFTGSGYWPRERYSANNDRPAIGLTVSDTWLIKAECLARAGKKDEAVDILNKLRKLRFRPADYADLTAATADEALQLVIDERRREFFGTGLRWFDQRRLNMDAMFVKTQTRKFLNITYTLEPNSSAYVFPLANILIAQNPEIEQNP